MRSKLFSLFVLAFMIGFFHLSAGKAHAVACSEMLDGFSFSEDSSNPLGSGMVYENASDDYDDFRMIISGFDPGQSGYKLRVMKDQQPCWIAGENFCDILTMEASADSSGRASFSSGDDRVFSADAGDEQRANDQQDKTFRRFLELETPEGARCEVLKYGIGSHSSTLTCGQIVISQNGKGCIEAGSDRVHAVVTGIKDGEGNLYNGPARLERAGGGIGGNDFDFTVTNGRETFELTPAGGAGEDFWFRIRINSSSGENICTSPTLTLRESCDRSTDPPIRTDGNDEDGETPADDDSVAFALCKQIPKAEAKELCEQCHTDKGIWTAIGCINREPTAIVESFMKLGLSLAGGIALLLFLAAAFEFSISQGDPKRTSDAKDRLTSAVIGIFFIIFSVTILQFIGVSIFQIPGFAQ